MYRSVVAQPSALRDVVQRTSGAVDALAMRLAGRRRVFLVGLGTSLHAARAGAHLFRSWAPTTDVDVWSSFDFVRYGPVIHPDDALVALSHRGTKTFTAAAVELAGEIGCPTALVTGREPEEETRSLPGADVVVRTVEQERSSAHTVSYTGSVAALAFLAARTGYHATGEARATAELLYGRVADALERALELEDEVAGWAERWHGCRRLWLVGAGPGEVVAEEAALKIKETSYLQAEGMSAEAMIHGPSRAMESRDLAVFVAPSGPGLSRVTELFRQVGALGPARAVVADAGARELASRGDGFAVVPDLPEPLASLSCLVPLQLFACHLARIVGTDPDGFRLDDPRFARAEELLEL